MKSKNLLEHSQLPAGSWSIDSLYPQG